jgi:capsular exopolysaccharide synthesis family protein
MEQYNTSEIYNNPQIHNHESDEDNSSFDIMLWVMKFVRYWYLFVIFIAGALIFTYLQNRKWQPEYKTSAQVMIDEGRAAMMYNSGSQNLMQGFGVQPGYRNVNNQIIMFGSYDLVRKVVKKLPLTVDCYTRGRFKINNLYKIAPVAITPNYISPEAYGIEYTIVDEGLGGYTILWKRNKKEYFIKGKYGVALRNALFSLNINRTDIYRPGFKFYFQFRSEDELVDSYSSRLAFDFVMQGASVVSVSLTGGVADRDIDFINTLAETFIAENLAKKNEVANKTIDFIEAQLASISDSISISEGRLKSYRVNNQIVDVESYTSQLLGDSRKVETDNSVFKLKEAYFNYLTNYLRKNIQNEVLAVPTSMGITDPALVKLVTDYNELQIKKKDVGAKNPFYAKYNEDLAVTKASLLEVLRSMRATLDIEKNDLKSKNQEVGKRIAQLPNQESQLSNYQRRFKIHDDYYTFLLQKRAESQIQKASNSADNVILEKARIMSVTNGGVKQKTRLLYLIIGILLPFLFVIIKELLNNKIIDKKDIERYSPYPYLGAIRHTNTKDPVPVQKSPRSGLAESYRVIRTRIEFVVQRQFPTSILVTSTESGDGKTAYSMNMAAMYALTGRKTVLVDLDLRKPSIANRLGISVDNKKGISNFLIGQIEFEDLIIKNTKYKFDIIPGGSIPPNPGELIRSEKLKDLYNKLCSMYDHVIIDTSPIGLVADAYALMYWVDANMFLVRSEKTNKLFFKSILQQVKSDKTPNIYIVLNDVDEKKASYSSYHEYGRRSYYMKKDEYHTYAKEYFDQAEDEIEVPKNKK